MNAKVKDVLFRAVKTFIEAVVACLVAALSGVDITVGGKDKTFWLGLAISAGSAGLSAAWNGVIQPWLNSMTVKSDGGT